MCDADKISIMQQSIVRLIENDGDLLKLLKDLRLENEDLKIQNERMSKMIRFIEIDFENRIDKMERKFYSMI